MIKNHKTLMNTIQVNVQLLFEDSQETQITKSSQMCSYPSFLILRVSSSHRLLVSTKMMVLFSFSLMISSSKRISLMEGKITAM